MQDGYIDIDLTDVVPYPLKQRSYVYVLKCEKGKWYVGYTETNESRLRNHFNGGASKWTRKYKPLALAKIIYGNMRLEETITLKMMKEFGIENVRGASWCHTDYPIPKKEIKRIHRKIKRL